MNWIERMYEIKGKDPYAQNGEGLLLEYVFHNVGSGKIFLDIGGGDGFYLSNVRHLEHLGWEGEILDLENGFNVTRQSMKEYNVNCDTDLLSIDIDGNDYWIIDLLLGWKPFTPFVIIAEFNPAFSDSRTIKCNPDHVWDGTDYYGFSFEAGKKLFEKHGYKVIFNVANMNMIAVRADLINVEIPPVTYQVTEFFEKSVGREWVMV
jgi:hypothetical protein